MGLCNSEVGLEFHSASSGCTAATCSCLKDSSFMLLCPSGDFCLQGHHSFFLGWNFLPELYSRNDLMFSLCCFRLLWRQLFQCLLSQSLWASSHVCPQAQLIPWLHLWVSWQLLWALLREQVSCPVLLCRKGACMYMCNCGHRGIFYLSVYVEMVPWRAVCLLLREKVKGLLVTVSVACRYW